ncbi:YjbQ family protein [Methanolobus sp.]|uniref:YjbQ family protein n=1 Tax=Methanolobus sp. TaxID=1874737 RepID=UPI003458BD0D
MTYFHNGRWHGGNGYSHIHASFIGQSESFLLIKILLGAWQQIVLMGLDDRPQSRKIIVLICGE